MWIAVLYNLVERRQYGAPEDLIAENEALATAQGVVEALRARHEALALRVTPRLLARIAEGGSRFDVVFNLAEGVGDRPGSEHLVPAFLELGGVPYTGADGTALALARDKARTKRLLAAHGLATPPWQLFRRENEPLDPALRFPLIVKPNFEDASIGIAEDSLVSDEAALRRRVRLVLERYGQPALVERYIGGREVACSLLGGESGVEALPLSEIRFESGAPPIVTFASKWHPGSPADRGQRPVVPAPLPEPLARRIVELARAAFHVIGCRDYARVDFRLESEGEPSPYIIDVNPNPAIDEAAGFARAARAAGIDYPELLERIVSLAAGRAERGFARRPELESSRLRLQPVAPSHLPVLVRWFNDPATGRYMDEPGRTYTEEEIAEALFGGSGDVDYIALDRGDGRPIGYCGLYDLDRPRGRAKITFLIGEPKARGWGLGLEMVALLLEAAFSTHELRSIEASVVIENEPSLRICRRLGFREIGRLRGSHRVEGRCLDELVFEIEREHWRPPPEKGSAGGP